MNYPFDYEPEDAFHGPAGELAKRLEKHVPMNIPTFSSSWSARPAAAKARPGTSSTT